KRPRLGLIQTRWSHLNADYSPLTRAQAIALDGHFVVEQTARQRSGFFMNFNGTAGIWRKECIQDVGGWKDDTVSEDLDLSYRAQLAGWEFLYLPQVPSPAEVPPQLEAFKRQQFRWAKGSIQCLMKLWRSILAAPRPIFVRLQGLIHLGGYLCHPLMLILLLATPPLMLWDGKLQLPLAYLSLASLGPPITYAISQRALYPDWLKRLAYLPMLVLLGTGIALNNACAVYEALVGRSNHFRRTPKFCLEGRSGRWAGSRYALPFSWMTLGEALLAFYSMMAILVALSRGNFYAVPFLLLYSGGFGYVAALGFWHSLLSVRRSKLKRGKEARSRLIRFPAGS
ncbi:MAG: glycosyltransferase family 2 protein, partial [Chloroflexota bacterium]|nr:glycosyltransferase family 2 protein [Chloroflexota bacterium]